MKITIEVTDGHAKRIHHFLRMRYKTRKTAKLETLCRIAILAEVAESAKDDANSSNITPQRMARPSAGATYAGGDCSALNGGASED